MTTSRHILKSLPLNIKDKRETEIKVSFIVSFFLSFLVPVFQFSYVRTRLAGNVKTILSLLLKCRSMYLILNYCLRHRMKSCQWQTDVLSICVCYVWTYTHTHTRARMHTHIHARESPPTHTCKKKMWLHKQA